MDNFIENLNWQNNLKNRVSVLHKTCSYTAMFPPQMINFLINSYSQENDLIVDTFSGRGTTLLETKLLKRNFIGCDLNPLAYVLSKAKSININKINIYKLLLNLEKQYFIWEKKSNDIILDPIMLIYYSDHNLKQIMFLREVLGKKWNNLNSEEYFLLSVILGLMHGPSKKDDQDSSYFSISMSNTTSMSPNYVKKYIIEHKLNKFAFNIFNKIEEKLNKIFKNLKEIDNFSNQNYSYIYFDNALNIQKYLNDKKINLIITSPPYLNIINYTNQNWIKLWFLGFDKENLKKEIVLSDNLNEKSYESFIKQYLETISNISNLDTKIILVIGDVIRKNKTYSFEDTWKKISSEINLKLVDIKIDHINQNNKSTNSLGTKKGLATRVDKIYIFVKN